MYKAKWQGKWEASNIIKCFTAGYDEVTIVSSEDSHLRGIEQQVSEDFITEISNDRLLFFQVDELISHLEEVSSNREDTTNTVEGYSVTAGYTEIDSQEQKILLPKSSWITKNWWNMK